MVVLDTAALPQIKMTVDEYLSAELPEGYRYELVEGVVQVAPIPDAPHDLPIERLHAWFVLYRERRSDLISHISQRGAVALLDRNTAREPDLAIYGPADTPRQPGKNWKTITPILVIESISPGQADRDYEEKRRDYWDAGVGEYWIADDEPETLTVLVRGPSDWIETVFAQNLVYRPAQFPGLDVPVGRLFEA